jgi:phosphoribosyl-ATP pyrophosphohydrolase
MDQNPTAELVLAALWRQSAGGDSSRPAVPPDAARIKRLAQELGEQAMQCVADTIGSRRADLVQNSARVLETLVSLWAACGLSPDEIWIELHKREQLGSLLMQLNQAKSRAPRRLLKPWRVDSTKLP